MCRLHRTGSWDGKMYASVICSLPSGKKKRFQRTREWRKTSQEENFPDLYAILFSAIYTEWNVALHCKGFVMCEYVTGNKLLK